MLLLAILHTQQRYIVGLSNATAVILVACPKQCTACLHLPSTCLAARRIHGHVNQIADWMAKPGNEREFVTLFFDDQSDLGDWVGPRFAEKPTWPRDLLRNLSADHALPLPYLLQLVLLTNWNPDWQSKADTSQQWDDAKGPWLPF